jgi:hypothetical protein
LRVRVCCRQATTGFSCETTSLLPVRHARHLGHATWPGTTYRVQCVQCVRVCFHQRGTSLRQSCIISKTRRWSPSPTPTARVDLQRYPPPSTTPRISLLCRRRLALIAYALALLGGRVHPSARVPTDAGLPVAQDFCLVRGSDGKDHKNGPPTINSLFPSLPLNRVAPAAGVTNSGRGQQMPANEGGLAFMFFFGI